MTIDSALNIWLNVATLLVAAGAITYASIWRYMD